MNAVILASLRASSVSSEPQPRPVHAVAPAPSGPYLLGLTLLFVAGWVDAIGFLNWRHLFVSFMSGNTTQFGVSAAAGELMATLATLLPIGCFIIGVIAGELLASIARRRATRVLSTELALLILAAALAALYPRGAAVIGVLAFAMGVQNAALHTDGRLNMALTYVTGTLVQFSRSTAKAMRGQGSWRDARAYFGMWLALAAGAVSGACALQLGEATAIALACVLVGGSLVSSAVLERRGGEDS